jgi:hypothetical protein
VDAFGANQASLSNSLITSSYVKSAFGYALNNVAYSQNGLTPLTDTTCIVPSGVSKIDMGNAFTTGYALCGTIKRIAYYPSRLSNTVIQALTT